MRKKDKPILKTTMQDVAYARFPDQNSKRMFFMDQLDKPVEGNSVVDAYTESQRHWEESEGKIAKYNEEIKNLDEDYSSFIPSSMVIVRCYHLEPARSESGIIIPLDIPMKEMTQNGLGVRKTYTSPWALSRKAVVVSVPEGFDGFKPGDVVELHRKCVLPEKVSVDHPAHLSYGFTLSEWFDFEPPANCDNKHFGYLAVNPFNDIIGKFKN
jgi:hypothetical protein